MTLGLGLTTNAVKGPLYRIAWGFPNRNVMHLSLCWHLSFMPYSIVSELWFFFAPQVFSVLKKAKLDMRAYFWDKV